MNIPTELYRTSLALLTDLYQLTMANAYWKAGIEQREAVFHLSFRKNPFQGGFTVACGLAYALDLIEHLRFDADDLTYLAGLLDGSGKPLFEAAFLDHLAALRFNCDVDAVPEGSVVFPQEPLVRVTGPIVQCQLLETPLLNLLNFQTLIATKAARICIAAHRGQVLEFGLRRAQGMDGALAASRAAFIGGCSATSNVLAGRLFGIPVRGTHAHSWVMAFDSELDAFRAYAKAMPRNCVFLVDTYDSLNGVRNAIAVGRQLREEGSDLAGIRLDSGDLASLSVEARKMLDAAGFPEAQIVASNDLDEGIIASLVEQGAAIDQWGVGTRLATAFDDPALGGVYKLSAIREPGGPWRHKIKLSEQSAKISTPGILQVKRFGEEVLTADAIYDETQGVKMPCAIVDPLDPIRRQMIPESTPSRDLLVPVFRAGRRVYDSPSLETIREHAFSEIDRLPVGVKRFVNPHLYPVGLERGLYELRTRLALEARGASS
jgi:nicotinate phosphoribosyltransferase